MITIVGISHTLNYSQKLEKVIYDQSPKAICIELDSFRYKFFTKQLSDSEIKTYFDKMPKIYHWLSLFKKKSQEEYKVDREWYIKTILNIADESEIDVIPIDIDKLSIYQEIEKNITLSEKIRIILSVIKELIFFKKHTDKKNLEEFFSKDYPTLKQYLIDKRNKVMAQEISKNMDKYTSLVVVVGNAHITGIINFVKKSKIKIVDLETLAKV